MRTEIQPVNLNELFIVQVIPSCYFLIKYEFKITQNYNLHCTKTDRISNHFKHLHISEKHKFK